MYKQNSSSSITKTLKRAFTLAEVLITLMIIGVIASTILSNIQSFNDKELKTNAKTCFAEISQAVLSLKNDNGGVLDNLYDNNALFLDAILDKMNVIKKCPTNSITEKCSPASYKFLNGTTATGSWQSNYQGAVLSNGSIITTGNPTSQYSKACNYTYTSNFKICGVFKFDVNGKKPPNTYGKDTFIIFITKNGVVPSGAPGAYGAYPDHYCPNYGYSCLSSVLKDEDYY